MPVSPPVQTTGPKTICRRLRTLEVSDTLGQRKQTRTSAECRTVKPDEIFLLIRVGETQNISIHTHHSAPRGVQQEPGP